MKEYSENIQIIKIQTTEDGDVLLLTKDKSLLRAYTDKEGKITMKQLHDSRPNVKDVYKRQGQQCSYKWAPPKGTVTEADFISLDKITDSTGKAETNRTSIKRNQLLFYHRNPEQTVFDVVVAQQGLSLIHI